MTEDLEALRFVAQQQSIIDTLVRKVYGPYVKFEHLSAFGQNTIEGLARKSNLLENRANSFGDTPSKDLTIQGQAAKIDELSEKLADALREIQDSWEENERLKMELYDEEDKEV